MNDGFTFVFDEVAHFSSSCQHLLRYIFYYFLLFFGCDRCKPFGQANLPLFAHQQHVVYLESQVLLSYRHRR